MPLAVRAVAAVAAAACLLGIGTSLAVGAAQRAGYQVLGMKTGSMTPLIAPGDLVVARSVPDTSVEVGHVITFRSPYPPQPPYTHRVISRDVVGEDVHFRTKGDANASPDTWTITYEDGVAYRLSTVVPNGGHVLALVQETWFKRLQAAAIFVLVLVLVWPAVVRERAAQEPG